MISTPQLASETDCTATPSSVVASAGLMRLMASACERAWDVEVAETVVVTW